MKKFLTSLFEKITGKLREKEQLIAVLEEKTETEENQHKAKRAPKKRKQRETKNAASINQFQDLSISISPQKMKLICVASDIRLNPDKTESAFMARQLVQATLPHKNPGDDVPAWSRKNGDLTLTLRAGWDEKKERSIGYPYGTLPRLLLFWITTEAIRTQNPRIELGNNLVQFMETLGLNPRGGGKRSDVKRLQNQMNRLFRSTISFSQSTKGKSWIDMQVAPKGMLWWDEKQQNKNTLSKNWIHLGEDFFKAITSAPVPVDMRILKALKRSPLALDLYTWATYTAYQTQTTKQSRSLSWEILHEQFGAEYNDVNNFSKKAWKALLKIQFTYPELNIERVPGGVKILPCDPSINIKSESKNIG